MLRLLLPLALSLANGDAGIAMPTPAPAPVVPGRPSLLAPMPAAPEPTSTSTDEYRLVRVKDGSGDLLYDEADGFSARVARDGSVSFRDKHITGLTVFPFSLLPLATQAGVPTLESTIRGIGKKRRGGPPARRPDPIADETRKPSTSVSRYRPDTREACQYPSPCFFDAPVLLLNLYGRFDVTDELMRLGGQDPYRFEKARFLSVTREMRIRLAARAHAVDVGQSMATLSRRLETIACDDRLSAGERRAIIEALRAEIDDATPEARASTAEIRRFLDALEHADGGAPCPAR